MRPTPTHRERAHLASATAKYGPDHPVTREARRVHRRARAESLIRQIVDDAPEFTDADREYLAGLLRPSDAVASAGAA